MLLACPLSIKRKNNNKRKNSQCFGKEECMGEVGRRRGCNYIWIKSYLSKKLHGPRNRRWKTRSLLRSDPGFTWWPASCSVFFSPVVLISQSFPAPPSFLSIVYCVSRGLWKLRKWLQGHLLTLNLLWFFTILGQKPRVVRDFCMSFICGNSIIYINYCNYIHPDYTVILPTMNPLIFSTSWHSILITQSFS